MTRPITPVTDSSGRTEPLSAASTDRLQADRGGPSYRGSHLHRAYRAHPDDGRLPLVLAAVASLHDLA